jgi:hypothetical protein
MKRPEESRYLLLIVVVGLVHIGLAVTDLPAGAGGDRSPVTAWAAHLQKVEQALGEKNVKTATQAWQRAYRAAVRNPGWEALVEVGDAYVRIGEAAGSRKAFEADARQIYLTAFTRARKQDSFDGVLQAAEAFARLGDQELVQQSLQIAKRLAAQDPEAEADLRAFLARLGEQGPGSREP